MKYFAITVAALSFSAPLQATLPVGAQAPDFLTQAALAGKPFTYSLEKARQKGPVVLYFFPAAFTPGCTVEAHAFAEAIDQFKKYRTTVIGVAADDIVKLSAFSVEECRNTFPVGVATPAMLKGFGVARPLSSRSNRTSYLITQDGRIAYVWSNPDYRDHVPGLLKALRAQKRSRR